MPLKVLLIQLVTIGEKIRADPEARDVLAELDSAVRKAALLLFDDRSANQHQVETLAKLRDFVIAQATAQGTIDRRKDALIRQIVERAFHFG